MTMKSTNTRIHDVSVNLTEQYNKTKLRCRQILSLSLKHVYKQLLNLKMGKCFRGLLVALFNSVFELFYYIGFKVFEFSY